MNPLGSTSITLRDCCFKAFIFLRFKDKFCRDIQEKIPLPCPFPHFSCVKEMRVNCLMVLWLVEEPREGPDFKEVKDKGIEETFKFMGLYSLEANVTQIGRC